MPTHPEPTARPPRRRADAERSIARILDTAVDALASDPDASMAAIARRAGVVRATIYVHFPTREALIDAVTQRAMTEVSAVIDAAEPERGDPADALRRVLTLTWRELGRYHALVAVTTQLPHAEVRAKHHPVLDRLEPLIARGQRDGNFRSDVPSAWHLSMLMALIHAASAELQAARIPADHAETALLSTALGAIGDGPIPRSPSQP
jgi:TetR/AcrR family transcriptional regulator, mexCD-oprJ operon repressor